ncbi:MAG TPA: energy transducer TonB [Malonomonas sp.]
MFDFALNYQHISQERKSVSRVLLDLLPSLVSQLSRYVKITVFIVLSFTLHLLLLFIELPRQRPHQTAQAVGVGLVQRSFPKFNAKMQNTDQVDSSPVLHQSEVSQVSTKIPAVLTPSAVVTEFVAPPERSVARAATPVVEKVPRVNKTEKVVESAPEMPLTNQSTGLGTAADFAPQKNSVEQGNITTAVELNGHDTMVFDSSSVPETQVFRDALPRYDLNPRPVYPEVSRRRGQQGTVLLEVAVLDDGSVEKAIVTQSSGFRLLDRAALTAVRRWRFHPATSAGLVVASRVVVPVDFVLHNDN